jgi:hypothetical protein
MIEAAKRIRFGRSLATTYSGMYAPTRMSSPAAARLAVFATAHSAAALSTSPRIVTHVSVLGLFLHEFVSKCVYYRARDVHDAPARHVPL